MPALCSLWAPRGRIHKQSRQFRASYPYQTMVPTMLLPYAQRPVAEVPGVYATAARQIFLYENSGVMVQEGQ